MFSPFANIILLTDELVDLVKHDTVKVVKSFIVITLVAILSPRDIVVLVRCECADGDATSVPHVPKQARIQALRAGRGAQTHEAVDGLAG